MTITKLSYYNLVPNTEKYQELFAQLTPVTKKLSLFRDTQQRLHYALKQFLTPLALYPFMLLKAPEEVEYLNLIADAVRQLRPTYKKTIFGGKYKFLDGQITFELSTYADGKFAVNGDVIIADWAEAELLFGCFREFNNIVTLHPGLIHLANGGVLVILLSTLLSQPRLWTKLKTTITHQRFDWMSFDKLSPLPVAIPSIPLSLKVILIGNNESLAKFQKIEPEVIKLAVYSEFEDNIYITNKHKMTLWCQWVYNLAYRYKLPIPTTDAWSILIHEAVRYTGDCEILPLCPLWLYKQLYEVKTIINQQQFTGKELIQMFKQRKWREGFLIERMQNEILLEQILIETDGKRIGQINALSVIESPGHPRLFGQPIRISCVVHIGNGEFINVEHKAELSDNIHLKGTMIMQAFLMTQLQLKQQIPFSASLTFEQSYYEVSGDSASMAELCVLISALADVPINQNIAITGSVDQFGHAQPVSNLNEKIEGFFTICQKRGLTGKQGVIIPVHNIRHLSLNFELLKAIEKGQFTIWTIEDINDALLLLTNYPWNGREGTTLVRLIQKRITMTTEQSISYYFQQPLRWLSRLYKK